jgi:predicted nucleic acid-binding protein
MEVLVDVNVIITFITQRDDPYKEECDQIIKKCSDGTINGYIAFHSLSIIWYVLRRKVNDTIARKWLKDISNLKDYVNADTPTVTPDVLLDIIKTNGIDG